VTFILKGDSFICDLSFKNMLKVCTASRLFEIVAEHVRKATFLLEVFEVLPPQCTDEVGNFSTVWSQHFPRILSTRSNWNRLIFDWVMPETKRWRFFSGHSVYYCYECRYGVVGGCSPLCICTTARLYAT